jgi:hypothetical protein
MHLPKLEIVTGDVANVQLTSETHIAGGRGGKARDVLDVRSKVINRTRVFLKTADGRERDFAFANTTVGVREGHRLSVVLAKGAGMKAPQVVLLHNHTTGQRDEMDAVLKEAVRQKTFGARWRALAGAVVIFLAYYGATAALNHGQVNPWLAVAIALGMFPILWGVMGGIDAVVLPQRERQLADRLHAEIEGRLRPLEVKPAPGAPT